MPSAEQIRVTIRVVAEEELGEIKIEEMIEFPQGTDFDEAVARAVARTKAAVRAVDE